ncbi:MAG: DUF5104 domain-containing protein, partial [Anaeroplasmataceae bacterium]|nr:DUF5104 domain-containing protein [Anaeroplasmataceae bacterium]
ILSIICVPLSSCGLLLYNDNDTIAIKNLETLVGYIEKQDKDQIKKLFAPNIVDQLENFDQQIDDLCAYYSGEYESFSAIGLGSGGISEYGKVKKDLEMLYDIHTTTQSFHLCMRWFIKDDFDENNIGIWSLYMESYINDNDCTTIEDWEIGIHLREPRE